MIAIHDIGLHDAGAILELNNAHTEETSPLDERSLDALLATAFSARCIDGGAKAFLIALDQKASYASPNFLWFKERRDAFVYVDRVIVRSAERGRGLARALYDDLFIAAKQRGQNRIVCEVNVDPPNPASENFHAKLGFKEVGRAAIYGGTRTVRYLEKLLN